MIEKLDKPSTTINSIDQIVDKLNEIIATVNEQEKKIDFIMENTEFADAPLRTPNELYEKR